MKPTRTAAVVAISFLLLTDAAQAQPGGNLEKAAQILAQQAHAGRGEFITYLTGAAAGYRWTEGERPGAKATYCPPPDLQLDGKGYANIALAEYKRQKTQYTSLPEYPLSVLALALLHGLQEKFPCQSDTDR